jgi:hypothetical protein
LRVAAQLGVQRRHVRIVKHQIGVERATDLHRPAVNQGALQHPVITIEPLDQRDGGFDSALAFGA